MAADSPRIPTQPSASSNRTDRRACSCRLASWTRGGTCRAYAFCPVCTGPPAAPVGAETATRPAVGVGGCTWLRLRLVGRARSRYCPPCRSRTPSGTERRKTPGGRLTGRDTMPDTHWDDIQDAPADFALMGSDTVLVRRPGTQHGGRGEVFEVSVAADCRRHRRRGWRRPAVSMSDRLRCRRSGRAAWKACAAAACAASTAAGCATPPLTPALCRRLWHRPRP